MTSVIVFKGSTPVRVIFFSSCKTISKSISLLHLHYIIMGSMLEFVRDQTCVDNNISLKLVIYFSDKIFIFAFFMCSFVTFMKFINLRANNKQIKHYSFVDYRARNRFLCYLNVDLKDISLRCWLC